MKRRPQRHKSSTPQWLLLAGLFTLVFVAAVLYLVIPREVPDLPGEPLPELKARLSNERNKRKRELQDELSDWELKNEQLRREIDRLKHGDTSP